MGSLESVRNITQILKACIQKEKRARKHIFGLKAGNKVNFSRKSRISRTQLVLVEFLQNQNRCRSQRSPWHRLRITKVLWSKGFLLSSIQPILGKKAPSSTTPWRNTTKATMDRSYRPKIVVLLWREIKIWKILMLRWTKAGLVQKTNRSSST